jgi:hypothetical protein
MKSPHLPAVAGSTVDSRQPVLLPIILVLLLSICGVNSTFAQAPYTGGVGDGHAMTEIVLRNVGVAELSGKEVFRVFPWLLQAGDKLHISTTSKKAYTIRIIDVTGKIQFEQRFDTPDAAINYTIPGLSFVVLENQSYRGFQKVIVIQ